MSHDFMKTVMIPIILVVIALLIAYLSQRVGAPPDNPLEQLSEKIIKDTTGITIDFSPNN